MKRRLLYIVLMSLMMALPLALAQDTAGGLIEPMTEQDINPPFE